MIWPLIISLTQYERMRKRERNSESKRKRERVLKSFFCVVAKGKVKLILFL